MSLNATQDELTRHLSSGNAPAPTADCCQHQLLVLNNNILTIFVAVAVLTLL